MRKVKKEHKFHIKSYKKEWELTNIKKLTALTENPKVFWSHLKTLTGKSKVTSEALNLISVDSLVKHFSTHYHSKQTNQNEIQVICNPKENCEKTDSILDALITIEEICKTIKELKVNRANGNCILISEMQKGGKLVTSPFLVTLSNKTLKTQYYLEEQSVGTITPLYKTRELENPDNYRGI